MMVWVEKEYQSHRERQFKFFLLELIFDFARIPWKSFGQTTTLSRTIWGEAMR